jgi:hypothetical protein
VLIDRLQMFPFDGNARLMGRIYNLALPKVDLLVLLTGDDNLIFDRKAEGPKSELLRNMNKAELAYANVPAHSRLTLDVSLTVAQHVEDIKNAIAEQYNNTNMSGSTP